MKRTYLIIFAVAFVVCGIAWMRFFYVAATNPSPVRYMTLEDSSGPRDAFRQICYGPAFVDGDQVWRFCEYGEPLDTRGLVRFDLKEGRADLKWPLPESPDAQILALAKAPTGELVTAWGSPDLSAVYRLDRAGQVSQLDGLPADLGTVIGLARVGTSVELVTVQQGFVQISTYNSLDWGQPRAVAAPDGCGETTICGLQLAYYAEPDWRFVYARTLREPGEPPTVELLLAAEDGTTDDLSMLALADLPESAVQRDDEGNLSGLGVFFDRAPGGVVNWTLKAAPWIFSPADQSVARLALPPQADASSLYAANYQVQAGRLAWLPAVRFPQRAWRTGDQWFSLRTLTEGTALSQLGADPGPILTSSTTFLQIQNGTQANVLPATNGDLWVLGPYGAYLQADAESLERSDGLNVVERIVRVFQNFGQFRPYHDDFYREQRALKLMALPLVLLSLPAGYLLVFFIRQMRKDRRAWIILLLQVSAVYLIVVTVFMWWFWTMMDVF